MKNKIFLTIVLALLVISSVSAWMPSTHQYIAESSLEVAGSSPVGRVVSNHFDDYMCGNYLTDSSVFYYFSEGFTAIGKEYKATHSTTLCERAVSLANRNNDQRQLAFAYGICSHHTQDSISHNQFIPTVVERTRLLNGLVHALAEEKVDDQLRTTERLNRVQSQLRNVCPDHKEFFVEVAEGSGDVDDINVGNLYDAFIDQVAGSDKYTVGFQSFLAVPLSIHLMLILVFVMSLLVLAYLVRLKNKNLFNIIAMILLAILIIFLVFVYILYFTGSFWKFVTWASYPLSQPLPTAGWETHVQTSVDETVRFMNGGVDYVKSVADPTGSLNLEHADETGSTFRFAIMGIITLILGLFIYLNFRRKN